MNYRKVSLPLGSARKAGSWELSQLSGGLNLEDPEYRLNDNQSPSCLNVWFYGRNLCKRPGTKVMSAAAAGAAVTAIAPRPYKGKLVYAAGTGLYAMDVSLGTVTLLWSGLTPGRGGILPLRRGALLPGRWGVPEL